MTGYLEETLEVNDTEEIVAVRRDVLLSLLSEVALARAHRQRLLEAEQAKARRIAELLGVRPCALCHGPATERRAIEAAMAQGESLVNIAARHGVSRWLLGKHRRELQRFGPSFGLGRI